MTGPEVVATRVVDLGFERIDDATEVLCQAFYDYPVMRFVLGRDDPDYDRRLRRLIYFFTLARFLRQGRVLGVVGADAELWAVANLNPPEPPAPSARLDAHRDSLWRDLESEARARYEAFGEATATFQFPEPHFHLGMIGARRDQAGRGHGRRLLEAVHQLAARHPSATGVSLTTEDPGNLPLYRKFGYRIVGHSRLEGLETWGFFRPDGSARTSRS